MGRPLREEDALKKGDKVTGAERDRLSADLRKKYDSGQSIRTLAKASGRSYGFVHRMLSESGATLRGRGGATRARQSVSPRRPRDGANGTDPLDALVRRGVVEAPRLPKSTFRLPEPAAADEGLSGTVIAQRG